MRKSRAYRIVIWIALALSLVVLLRLSSGILIQPRWIMNQDFAQFWAAGRLNLMALNPYDPHQIQQLKGQIAGEAEVTPAVITLFYSPPWSMLMAMPFGVLPYLPSRLLWLVVNIVVLFISARLLWHLYGGSEKLVWLSWLVVLTFGPTYLVLVQGQITPLMLLGLAGFLYCVERRQNDWLAGVFAALVSIKPQLFYLFWFALLLWVVNTRRWKILVSLCVVILGATVASAMFNPLLIPQYIEALSLYPPVAWLTPTIGVILRLIFGESKYWLQYIPPAIGLIWFIWYWKHHHTNWIWSQVMPVLLFVSLITAPHAWSYDQILLIAALIPAWIGLVQMGNNFQRVLLFALYAFINILYLVLHRFYMDEYFIWFAPALFLWWWLVHQMTGVGTRLEFDKNS